jgi:hypothetical protein
VRFGALLNGLEREVLERRTTGLPASATVNGRSRRLFARRTA